MPDPTSPADQLLDQEGVQRIEAELAAITPGDWEFNIETHTDITDERWTQFEVVVGAMPIVILDDDEQSMADARFIANAPTHVRRLLEALSLSEQRNREVEGERERLRNGVPNPESIRFGIEAEPWEGNGPCMDCKGRSPYWHAPSNLWRQVMSIEGDTDYPAGCICPICFVIRAWHKGLFTDPLIWWTWTPIPTGFLPEGDWLHTRDERDAAERQRDAYKGTLAVVNYLATDFAISDQEACRQISQIALAALADTEAGT